MIDKYKANFLKNDMELTNNLITSCASEIMENRESFNREEIIYTFSNIFTLSNKIDLFIHSYEDFERQEFEDFIEYSGHVLHEMKEIIFNNDRNTSWLYSRFNQYNDVYKAAIDSINQVI